MKKRSLHLFVDWSSMVFKASSKAKCCRYYLPALFLKCLVVTGLLLTVSCQEKEVKNDLAVASRAILDYPIQPVPFTSVHIQDDFWTPRLETNRQVTLPYNFKKCEETGRLRNFAIAGGLEEGEFEGIFFNDSDVFKVIEGASYSLQVNDDPELKSFLDDLIRKIAAAQEADGYLYTNRTIDPEKAADGGGPKMDESPDLPRIV